MWTKLLLIKDFIGNNGMRYVFFRAWHVFQVKTGIFKHKFPSYPEFKHFISLDGWRDSNIPFFIDGKDSLKLDKELHELLEVRFRESVNNKITFFNSQQIQLDQKTQWSVNPTTGYAYNLSIHWSQIPDLSKEAGDIKFVWEKARFSYLYDILRYDYHSSEDQSVFVLEEIEDFIDTNPLNLGPQYKCSQEISLRVLNWTYALYYYKNSEHLTEQLFQKIINAIYWQLHHVRKNINFSRIAVRNNHAITETLMLYLSGLLFPFIPETKKWSKEGEKWFEQEIEYQIYPDGTFLQYSMNYHRVVVQLLTWAIKLNDLNGLRFKEVVYDRAQKSLDFLDACLDKKSGRLPNYGSNDGALFFKFTDLDYRDYTSQLDDLRMVLQGKAYSTSESFAWYGMQEPKLIPFQQEEIASFDHGGYYIINENGVKTFLKCGAYKDRPAQADNLHLDLWVNGINYLWDCGSFKYNTEEKYLKHFMGTAGHNTISIGDHDQMLKGGRFIWFYWIKKAKAALRKNKTFEFTGSIDAYRHLGTKTHTRKVLKEPGVLQWKVVDTIDDTSKIMTQNWHINPAIFEKITFAALDQKGTPLKPVVEEKWMSSYYGVKEPSIALRFETDTNTITTVITINP